MASKRFKGRGRADRSACIDTAAKLAYLKRAMKIWGKEHGKLGCRR